VKQEEAAREAAVAATQAQSAEATRRLGADLRTVIKVRGLFIFVVPGG